MKGNFSQLTKSNVPVLVDFYADWCQPCKTMSPILQATAKHFGVRLKIIKINVDKHQNLAAQYKIQGVPTLILFQNGTIKWRQSGVVPQMQLTQTLEKFC